MRRKRQRPVVCLAGSGGGHLRQLLDLEPVWSRHDSYILTEDTALGRSLAEKWPVDFVHHYTLGQARIGLPGKMIAGALRNLVQSWRSVRERRPDVIITTGAASMFWTCVFAKLRGARIIAIESFARFDHPSKFGRLVRPIANDVIVQSAGLAARTPGAKLFDPFRMLEGTPPPKQPLVFVTVGATLPFERMTRAVIELKRRGELAEKLIVQTGDEGIIPGEIDGLTQHETLPFDQVKAILRDAAIVITHGGTGSLITALQNGCRVIAVPRSFALKEIYDHHQDQIVDAFVARGLIVRCDDVSKLEEALTEARAMTPKMATTDPAALMEWLDAELGDQARPTAT